MKQNYILSLIILVFVFGCSKTETLQQSPNQEIIEEEKEESIKEPITSTYLTVKTGCKLSTGSSGNWIMLHDENGLIIDFKPYELNETITFQALESQQPNQFSITSLSVNEFLGNVWHRLNSIAEIKKGTFLDFSCTTEETISNPILGNFKLIINNVPDNPVVKGFNASNGHNNGIAYSESSNGGFITYEADLNIYQNKTEYLISVQDGNQNSKYYGLSDYNIDDEIVLNYLDFMTYDDYLNIDYPLHSQLRILNVGYNVDQKETYSLTQAFSQGASGGTLRVGQLNRFDSYEFLFGVSLNLEYEYQFQISGALPDALVIPEQPSIVIENSSVNSFQLSTNISNYINKKSSWIYSSDEGITTTWDIESSENYSPNIGDIPAELLMQYPDLNLENLLYTQTSFKLNEEETIILLNPT
jgi:hypothetical protein